MTDSKFPWAFSAEEEYKKDPNLKPESIKEIQEWMLSQEHLPTIDEEMIQHVFHACFYRVEQTKNTIDALYTFKNTMPEFFTNWDTNEESLKETYNDVIIGAPLPYCDSEGYRIIVCKLNDSDTSKFNYANSVKWLLMTTSNALWTTGIQKGYIIVYDAAGFSMSHMLKCSLSSVKNYIAFGEKASPLRVVKVVFINTSSVVKNLMSIVRPFLNKDLINMISFHTSADPYFKDLIKENVPLDYGGTAPPLLSLHRDNIKQVLLNREWLLMEESLKSDESKRIKKSKNSPTKSNKAFKKLEID